MKNTELFMPGKKYCIDFDAESFDSESLSLGEGLKKRVNEKVGKGFFGCGKTKEQIIQTLDAIAQAGIKINNSPTVQGRYVLYPLINQGSVFIEVSREDD